MFFLGFLIAIHYSSAAPCPAGACIHAGINCIANCSNQFCLCDTHSAGSMMTTANGTLCYNGYQIHETDYRCSLVSLTLSPSPAPSPTPYHNPSPQAISYPSCECETPGVHCIQQCEPYMCLCGASMTGTQLQTAPSTVCMGGYQVWESSPACSSDTSDTSDNHFSVCSNDGFYCMSHCSLSYYMCSNGIPSATMLTPYGTVCGVSYNNTGELIHPNECNATDIQCSHSGIQCITECGDRIQICMDTMGYALQTVPNGLLCNDNGLVLSSQCILSNQTQSPSVSFDIMVQSSNDWTVLSDSAVVASVVDSIASVGSNVPITPSMVSVSVSDSSRRQLQSRNPIRRTISIYAPLQWDSTVIMDILNTSSGSSLLADSLQFRNYQMITTTSTSSTPTSPPVANFRAKFPNNTGVSEKDSITVGVIVGGIIVLTFLCIVLRRCMATRRDDAEIVKPNQQNQPNQPNQPIQPNQNQKTLADIKKATHQN